MSCWGPPWVISRAAGKGTACTQKQSTLAEASSHLGPLQSPPVQKTLEIWDFHPLFPCPKQSSHQSSPYLWMIREHLDFTSNITTHWLPRNKKKNLKNYISKSYPILHPGKTPTTPNPEPKDKSTTHHRRCCSSGGPQDS